MDFLVKIVNQCVRRGRFRRLCHWRRPEYSFSDWHISDAEASDRNKMCLGNMRLESLTRSGTGHRGNDRRACGGSDPERQYFQAGNLPRQALPTPVMVGEAAPASISHDGSGEKPGETLQGPSLMAWRKAPDEDFRPTNRWRT